MDVTLHGLTKRFDQEDVLVDIRLDLRPRQTVAVIGLNGAGKTTLLRCLAGVITPTRGTIRWENVDSLRDDIGLHRQMMFLPDMPLLLEDQSVVENILVFLRAYARDTTVQDEAIVGVLRELDLLDQSSTMVARLSRGQRYKTALSAMLLVKPEVWLLDEPFASGMDPQGMQTFKRHARSAVATGSCLVYTTQILEIAERFCDVLLVLDRGHPIFAGSWSGLPMGTTILGSLPRRWWWLLRIMLTFNGRRFLAGAPIMLLALVAVASSFGAVAAKLTVAAWLILMLWTPWLAALRLVQRTRGGIDLGLGRALITAGGLCCLVLQLATAIMLIVSTRNGIHIGSCELGPIATGCSAVLGSLLTSLAHLGVLRHAYRRTVDFVAPSP